MAEVAEAGRMGGGVFWPLKGEVSPTSAFAFSGTILLCASCPVSGGGPVAWNRVEESPVSVPGRGQAGAWHRETGHTGYPRRLGIWGLCFQFFALIEAY